MQKSSEALQMAAEYEGGIFVDGAADQHVTFLIDTSGTAPRVLELNAFGEGLVHDFDMEEFIDSLHEFTPVDESVVGDPQAVTSEALTAMLNGQSQVSGYGYEDIAYVQELASRDKMAFRAWFGTDTDTIRHAMTHTSHGDFVEMRDEEGRTAYGHYTASGTKPTHFEFEGPNGVAKAYFPPKAKGAPFLRMDGVDSPIDYFVVKGERHD